MKSHVLICSAIALVACGASAQVAAQSTMPAQKEDLSVDLIYQGSHSVGFDGGSSVDVHDDLGFGFTYTYRFTPHFELQGGMDFQWINDNANIYSSGGQQFRSDGSIHLFTPHVDGIFNFLSGDFTPYVSAGLGWTWIDTSIPSSPAYTACWWDPWWGYYCGVYQNTHNTDEFVYEVGAGVRWDFGEAYTVRLAYQKRWIDMSEASGKPGFDQIRLSLAFRY